MDKSSVYVRSAKSALPSGSTQGQAAYVPSVVRWLSPFERKDPAMALSRLMISMTQQVYLGITSHAGSTLDKEVGGLLLGEVIPPASDSDVYFVTINAWLEAKHTEATSNEVELNLNPDTWRTFFDEKEERYPDKVVVGWFHTHPRMSLFLSQKDLLIHRGFFKEPWQVALVVEPAKDQGGFFCWRDGEMEGQRYTGFLEDTGEAGKSLVSWTNLTPARENWQEGGSEPDPFLFKMLVYEIKAARQWARFATVASVVSGLLAGVALVLVATLLTSVSDTTRELQNGLDRSSVGVSALQTGIDRNSKGIGSLQSGMDQNSAGIGRLQAASDDARRLIALLVPTSTPTATSTATDTPSPTSTPTDAPTVTSTPTNIPTATSTTTNIPTATSTATSVPTASSTPAAAPTATGAPDRAPTARTTPAPSASPSAGPSVGGESGPAANAKSQSVNQPLGTFGLQQSSVALVDDRQVDCCYREWWPETDFFQNASPATSSSIRGHYS